MLYTPASGFLWSVDNFGATYTTAGWGTAVASHASAHTKGTDVELIADTSVTEDVYGIAIHIGAINASANIRNLLWDIKADRAGGTTYVTFIENLFGNSEAMTTGGRQYYFPVYLPAGSAIAAAVQCNVGATTGRIGVRLYGKPTNPEMVKTGAFVRTFGATTASSNGTSVTPGTNAMGSYSASLGTTADDLWWWQVGIGSGDTTRSDVAYYIDVAAGDATNKVLCVEHAMAVSRAAENDGGCSAGLRPAFQPIASGADVYVRAATGGTPDGTITCIAYGVGG